MALGTVTVPLELRFDAGRICLDLLATDHPEERLDSVEVLRAWITGSGLVPPGTPLDHADHSWPPAFRELRDDTERLVEEALRDAAGERAPEAGRPGDLAALDRLDSTALTHLNSTARAAPPAPRAVRAPDGALVRELAGPPECAALLAALARDAVELLTDPVARGALRRCEGDSCPIVYLDTSRGRRRRWCSSEVCGNRERVARHRRRAAALARA
ncbi:CGNR zinc finger domain-containing protein [Streptomyces sp. CRN 30]|uniref:CGNR zinc finger domain-containing protein n=1 Tax=Streptomyces sp. CRN 30 TaxID=3075613 RepID=UPI002A7F711B|nr:CGNR zinc finger domain-containing protein [Streptomyces sp. CRN 30]